MPLILAAMPFGVVFGAMATAAGLSSLFTMAMSVLVFAGSSQFIAVALISGGSAALIIIATTFIVNLRQLLYSISLLPHVRKVPQAMRLPLGFLLTDETFATVVNRLAREPDYPHWVAYYLGSGLFMYGFWLMSTAVGVIAGNAFPALTEFGLDIAMVVAFVGIVIANLKMPSHYICALVAGVSGLLTYHWPHQSGLLFSAFIAIACGVIAEQKLTKTTKGGGDE
nr:AzlC family ABC transporter permease [Neptunicella marina]